MSYFIYPFIIFLVLWCWTMVLVLMVAAVIESRSDGSVGDAFGSNDGEGFSGSAVGVCRGGGVGKSTVDIGSSCIGIHGGRVSSGGEGSNGFASCGGGTVTQLQRQWLLFL